jgi:hypothetical protein
MIVYGFNLIDSALDRSGHALCEWGNNPDPRYKEEDYCYDNGCQIFHVASYLKDQTRPVSLTSV